MSENSHLFRLQGAGHQFPTELMACFTPRNLIAEELQKTHKAIHAF
jgi:hypothetical protein